MSIDAPTELHDRLRAANPVPDVDGLWVPPAFGPQPEQEHRRRAPRRAIAGAAAAALVATALVLAGLAGTDPRPGRGGVAQAAVRALDPDGRILHMSTRVETRSTNLPDRIDIRETWLAPGGTAGRTRRTAADGTVLTDSVLSKAPSDPTAYEFDFVRVARRQIEDGTLRPVGKVKIDGRSFERFRTSGGEITWDFDAETLEPSRMSFQPAFDRGGGFVAVTSVLGYERLADTEANRKLLTPPRTIAPEPRVTGPNGDQGPATERP